MKGIFTIIIISFSSLLTAQQLFDNDNRLSLQLGIDPSTLVSLKYEKNLKDFIFSRDLYPYVAVTFAPSKDPFKRMEYKIGERLPIVSYYGFQCIKDINLSYGRVETENFISKKIAFEIDLALGKYWNRGYIAATLSYEKIMMTSLNHSSYYKNRFYADAQDGWYKNSGGSIQIGLEYGLKVSKNVDMFMEFKIPRTAKWRAYMGSPAHMNIGFGLKL